MKEKNDNRNISNMDSIFNNKTLRYRINGFAHACRMDDIEVHKVVSVKNPYWLGTIDNHVKGYEEELNSAVIFSTQENKRTCEGNNYFVAVNKNDDGEFGKNVILSGHYDDLSFQFINYYGNKKLDRKVMEIPFKISLAKLIDNDNYKMDIETVNGIETKITFSKYREHKKRTISYKRDFYVNICDFSDVLKLVKSFVYNPELVFGIYNEIMDKKKVLLSTVDMRKAIMQDASLDKPVGKVKTLIKKIID